MAKTSTIIEIKAPKKKVYQTITHFEQYPEFLSGIKSTKVLSQESNKLQVEFQIETLKTVTYSLNVVLRPSEGFSWELIKGDFMKSNTGNWQLEEKNGLTVAHYDIEVNFIWLVPDSAVSTLINKSLPKMMQEFKEQIENG